jgi:hypothetical protein
VEGKITNRKNRKIFGAGSPESSRPESPEGGTGSGAYIRLFGHGVYNYGAKVKTIFEKTKNIYDFIIS